VNPSVLIPRPETEILTERALKYATQDMRLLDMCCGSGCIGLTVAAKTKAAVVLADNSQAALDTAARNAKKLHVKAEIVLSDMFESIQGEFDLIVCNPPYIPSADIATLDKNVRDYEPISALDGGADGLDFYRIIATHAPRFMASGAVMLLEIGIGQEKAVTDLLSENGYEVEIFNDLEGVPRVVKAIRGGKEGTKSN